MENAVNIFLVVVIAYWLSFGFFCNWLAREKVGMANLGFSWAFCSVSLHCSLSLALPP